MVGWQNWEGVATSKGQMDIIHDYILFIKPWMTSLTSNYASKQDIPRVGVCSKKAETNDFDSKIARKHPPSNSVKHRQV